jgi:hypothetical protein
MYYCDSKILHNDITVIYAGASDLILNELLLQLILLHGFSTRTKRVKLSVIRQLRCTCRQLHRVLTKGLKLIDINRIQMELQGIWTARGILIFHIMMIWNRGLV